MSFTLYPDQSDLVASLRASIAGGSKAPLVVLPTGGGKTVIFSWLCAQLHRRGKRVQILSHRQELLKQINDTLREFNVPHTMCSAGMHYNPREAVCNSSIFTVARRLGKIQVPDVVIADEGHHYTEGSTWDKTISFWREHNPNLLVIGFTATPERLDGSGLDHAYDDMVQGLTTAELIQMGRLSDYTLFAPPGEIDTSELHVRMGDYKRDEAATMMQKPKIMGNAIRHYAKYLQGRPAVAFCVSVKHAMATAADFRSQGWKAACIEGSMTTLERRQVNRDFRAGHLNVMTSCDLISEGYDVPGMHGAILLRPTMSLALYLQQVGRALRKADGKEKAYLLDHVGNSHRHGLPDMPREWSLEGRPKRKRADVERDIQVKMCPSCGAASPSTAVRCRDCGDEFPIKHRKIEEVEGDLEEVSKEEAARRFVQARYNAKDLDALIQVGKMRKMSNPEGWARHVLAAREKKKMGRRA